MLSNSSKTMLVAPNELDSETRSIVMDFMGLVPLSCPATSAFFEPFESNSQCKKVNDLNFDNSYANNNDTSMNRNSVPLYRTSRRNSSVRYSLATPSSRRIKRENSFRTIIRKHNKFVVLEETTETTEDTKHSTLDETINNTNGSLNTSSSVRKDSFKNGRRKLNLTLNVDISRDSKLKPIEIINPSSRGAKLHSNINFFDPNEDQILRKRTQSTDGTSVDLRESSLSPSIKGHNNGLILNSKENLYVDISKISGLEQMVDNGELSPVVVPLHNELKGLRMSLLESFEKDDTLFPNQPISPSAQVADTLRAIADQVQEDFANELSGAVGKLVNFEESKRLTFEVLKEVAMELTKDIAPGWTRIVLPLVLTQTSTMAMLLLGNRSIVGKLVDYTTRFLCDDMDESFKMAGGWEGVKNTGFREIPMSLDEITE